MHGIIPFIKHEKNLNTIILKKLFKILSKYKMVEIESKP
jgi:hypothetical protein